MGNNLSCIQRPRMRRPADGIMAADLSIIVFVYLHATP